MGERGSKILRLADRFCGIPLSLPAAMYRKLARPRKVDEIKSACIFCPGAIGDLVLTSALIEGLHKVCPGLAIDVIASGANSQALPLLPRIRSGWAIPITRPDKILALLRHMRHDVLLDTCQWARLGNLISNLSMASITVGFRKKGQFRSLGYDHIVEHDNKKHEVENFLSLGRSIWPNLDGRPKLAISASGLGNTAFCHMWPARGIGRALKLWPEGHWRDLIEKLLAIVNRVALTGSGDDSALNQAFIEKHFAKDDRVVNLAGRLSLIQLAKEMARGAGLISVNTGIMHLGAAIGIPVIGLHGPTNPVRWGPFGDRAISLVPAKGHNCYLDLGFEYPKNAVNNMEAIEVDEVLEKYMDLRANFEAAPPVPAASGSPSRPGAGRQND